MIGERQSGQSDGEGEIRQRKDREDNKSEKESAAETEREKEKACREIAKDEVGKDKIRRIAFQPTQLVLNFIKSSATNSEQFKDCQNRFCATQSLPY